MMNTSFYMLGGWERIPYTGVTGGASVQARPASLTSVLQGRWQGYSGSAGASSIRTMDQSSEANGFASSVPGIDEAAINEAEDLMAEDVIDSGLSMGSVDAQGTFDIGAAVSFSKADSSPRKLLK